MFGLFTPYSEEYFLYDPAARMRLRVRHLLGLGTLLLLAAGAAYAMSLPLRPGLLAALLALWLALLIAVLEKSIAYRLTRWRMAPTQNEWDAAVAKAFKLEYPRWEEFTAKPKYSSTTFWRLKRRLERDIRFAIPETRWRMDNDALMRVIGLKFDDGDGLRMHVLYRNWEVAKDTMDLRHGRAKAIG